MKERLTHTTALVIVDAQRGFMPATEGDRLGLPGFGELGVPGGERIVHTINELTRLIGKGAIATTQDWHPPQTAHFSDQPNYVDTWPVHCVAETTGAALHPDLLVAQDPTLATRFIKGDTPCTSPEDDTSYTGAIAKNSETGLTLPEWLTSRNISHVIVTGLALGDGADHKLCVDSTAVDLHRLSFDVTVATDATEAVLQENRALCLGNLARQGIRLATTEEIISMQGEK